jgi:dTDP-4-amino-4,6-dideoxygalactose transaminase
MAALKAAGIPSVVYYPRPLHCQTAYAGFPRDPAGLPESENAAEQVFSIPMHAYLDEATQEYIIDTLWKALEANA